MPEQPNGWNADCSDEDGCGEQATFDDTMHGAAALLTWLHEHRHKDACIVLTPYLTAEQRVIRRLKRAR